MGTAAVVDVGSNVDRDFRIILNLKATVKTQSCSETDSKRRH